jgi:hypothetical protein
MGLTGKNHVMDVMTESFKPASGRHNVASIKQKNGQSRNEKEKKCASEPSYYVVLMNPSVYNEEYPYPAGALRGRIGRQNRGPTLQVLDQGASR